MAALAPSEDRHEETLEAFEQSERLAATDIPPEDAIAALGRDWVAEEALAISVYCTLVARDLEQGLILAVNHDGDSDSNGSIAGKLLGGMHGIAAIPRQWLERLELRNVIEEVAEDLYVFKDRDIGEYSANEALTRRVWQKYPGW